jgi:hypothetical protein
MTDTDLLGDVPEPAHGKHYIKQWGYFMPPGTGPAGETCGSCKHIARGDKYRKCRRNEVRWTHGPKTDILSRSPACSAWEGT